MRIFLFVLFSLVCNLFAANPTSTTYVQEYVQEHGGSPSPPPPPPPPTYTIGEYAQGGVIFWLTPDGAHGLVASIVDMPEVTPLALPWAPMDNTIGATANGIVFGLDSMGKITTPGKINTDLIVTKYGAATTYAAGACAAYSVTIGSDIYGDWYLPCLDELGLMMANKTIIDAVSMMQGGTSMGTNVYWSSFERTTGDAWLQYFSDARQSSANKTVTYRVRAVRAF